MLTTAGKQHIKRRLSDASLIQSIAFGIGDKVESVNDTALQLEVVSVPVNLVTLDLVNNKIIYKASIPESYVGKIYEVGGYSLLTNPTIADHTSRLISTFDSATEDWVNPSTLDYAPFTTANTRVGEDSLSFTPGASATTTYALQNIGLNLEGYSAADKFIFAYNVGNANTNQITVRFMTDASHYFEFALGSQTAGYKFVERTIGSATVTGAPSWSNISQIQVLVTSSSGGASAVNFDALRILDIDSPQTDYVLVARKVLSSPETKIAGRTLDIEFSLDVTV